MKLRATSRYRKKKIDLAVGRGLMKDSDWTIKAVKTLKSHYIFEYSSRRDFAGGICLLREMFGVFLLWTCGKS